MIRTGTPKPPVRRKIIKPIKKGTGTHQRNILTQLDMSWLMNSVQKTSRDLEKEKYREEKSHETKYLWSLNTKEVLKVLSIDDGTRGTHERDPWSRTFEKDESLDPVNISNGVTKERVVPSDRNRKCTGYRNIDKKVYKTVNTVHSPILTRDNVLTLQTKDNVKTDFHIQIVI